MKKWTGFIMIGVALGAAVFFIRRESVSFFTAAVDGVTLSGGGILLFCLLGSLLRAEGADGMRYAMKAGVLGLFPFMRAQSFRLFKKERAERRKQEGEEGSGAWFGLFLFLIGVAFSCLMR